MKTLSQHLSDESRPVVIGGAIALIGYIIFYLIVNFGLAITFADWLAMDPTIIALLLLLVTFLPGPFVAGFLQPQGIRGGLQNGIYAAFFGIVIPFTFLVLDEILRVGMASEGPEAVLFGRGFAGFIGNFAALVVLVLAFTGTVGGVTGSLVRRLKENST